MAKVSRKRAAKSSPIDRTNVRNGDEDENAALFFGPILADVAILLWPKKTAANLAAEAGCSVRAAEFYLSGQREWSADALSALLSEILKRHKLRNLEP